jgi:hypothetical protein
LEGYTLAVSKEKHTWYQRKYTHSQHENRNHETKPNTNLEKKKVSEIKKKCYNQGNRMEITVKEQEDDQ